MAHWFSRSPRALRMELDALITQRRELDAHIEMLARTIARAEAGTWSHAPNGHRMLRGSMATPKDTTP